jgi:hypothetical protein
MKYKSAADILLRVRFATHQIESARKQAMAVYDEDLRHLRDLDSRLATAQAINEPELFEMAEILSPEVEQLLAAPLAKYS